MDLTEWITELDWAESELYNKSSVGEANLPGM
jgi:hypothetical protein